MNAQQLRRRRRLRSLMFESLETRDVFSGDSGDWEDVIPWNQAGSLTMSFAPDGTHIGDHTSSLFATLGTTTAADWQAAIQEAFETWARSVNVNVGVVPDDGSSFGTAAPSHGDLRFGDVRFGAVPMSSDELAVAIPHNQPLAGSWSGDILFNSEVDFSSIDKVFEVALHEIGHVLGLGHSADTQSPMYPTFGDQRLQPTVQDLLDLQTLYGARAPDIHEGAHGNNSTDDATSIKYADEVEAGQPPYDGSTPLVVYGEVSSSADPDVFQLKVLAGYTGPITVTVRTSTFSLLAPQVTALTSKGQVIATASAASGADAVLALPGGSTSKYFLKVESATGASYDFGSYALLVTFDDLLSTSSADIERVVRSGRRLVSFDESEVDEADMRRMFQSPQALPVLDDDQHLDDDDQSGSALTPVVESPELVDYHAIATLSDSTDIDNYIVEPSEMTSNSVDLLITLESIDVDGLIPKATLYDDRDQAIPLRVLANGLGMYVAQATGIPSDQKYRVQIQHAADAGSFTTGNYEFSAKFSQVDLQPTTFASGTIAADDGLVEQALYVGRTQLFSLTLESSLTDTGVLWATIYDENFRPLSLIATQIGETRSSTSVLLDPGAYTIQFGARGGSGAADVDYALIGQRLDQPIGPPIVDPTTTPVYSCQDLSLLFCFPGGVITPVPILIVPVVTPTVPFPTNATVTPPADSWFWNSNPTATNPTNPLDVNADKSVAPNDALVIINDLNANGSRQLPPPLESSLIDVNQDGFSSPVDALIVINAINGPAGGGEGEGPSVLGMTLPSVVIALADGNVQQRASSEVDTNHDSVNGGADANLPSVVVSKSSASSDELREVRVRRWRSAVRWDDPALLGRKLATFWA